MGGWGGGHWKENRLGGNLTAASVTSMCFFFFFLRQLRGNLAQTGVVWERYEGGILPDAETGRESVSVFGGGKKTEETT